MVNDKPFLSVLYITPGGIQGRGGMGRMAQYLVDAFRRLQPALTVTVLDAHGSGGFLRMIAFFLRAYFVAVLRLATRRDNVLHVHMSFGGSAVRKLAFIRLAGWFGVGSLLHIHGSEFRAFYERLPATAQRLLVASMRKATRIVVIGAYWADFLADTLKIDRQRIAIVYNGVPAIPAPERFVSPGPCRILCLGILSERKGTSDLLKALAALDLPPSAWRAVIAGNGAVDRYRGEAEALGLADQIVMPGWVSGDRVPHLLREADIFVLPSYHEGLPVAILEAMAASLPVIATPVGAVGEAVVPGLTGRLVQAGDIKGLATAIQDFVVDGDLRLRLGRAGRQRFEQLFTIDVAAQSLLSLYQEVARLNTGS